MPLEQLPVQKNKPNPHPPKKPKIKKTHKFSILKKTNPHKKTLQKPQRYLQVALLMSLLLAIVEDNALSCVFSVA